MTCPVTVPAVALHPILYRFVPGNPCYLCAGRVYSFGEQQWDRIDRINKACQPSVMQSTPGRHICWTLLSGRRPTWGDSASGLLPNGHMKGEFEKCCNRGNPIFRAPVCSWPCLCKKKGRKKNTRRKSGGKYTVHQEEAKPSQARPSQAWEKSRCPGSNCGTRIKVRGLLVGEFMVTAWNSVFLLPIT